MISRLKKDILGLGRMLIVCFLMMNILLPHIASFFTEVFPSLKTKSVLSWSAEKTDIDQEDEKESEAEKEKEKEIDKDFFIQIDQISLLASWYSNYSSKYFYERGYPIQIFPITIPPPRYLIELNQFI